MDGLGSNKRGHARAGDAELILRTTQRQSAVMMVVVLPYTIRVACSLSSRLMAALSGAAATAGAAGAADSLTPVGTVVNTRILPETGCTKYQSDRMG